MISREEYIQLRAFARQDGLWIGLLWIATLGCFVGSIKEPALQTGFITGVIATPFVLYFRLRRFRDNVLDGSISYSRATAFCILTTTYASILMAGATLLYFYFLDNGMLINALRNNISMPELRESFRQTGLNPEELETEIEAIGGLRPIEFAFSIFFNGIVTSSFLSLILGLIGMRSKKRN